MGLCIFIWRATYILLCPTHGSSGVLKLVLSYGSSTYEWFQMNMFGHFLLPAQVSHLICFDLQAVAQVELNSCCVQIQTHILDQRTFV